MTQNSPDLRLLGLSSKEERVLIALRDGIDTPLLISRATKVSRPAVYATLGLLKSRGLATSHIRDGRKSWQLTERRELEKIFFETKRTLLQLSLGTQEVFGVDDAVVTVHKGKEAVHKLLGELMFHHQNERFYGLQGGVAAVNWHRVFSDKETNAFNRAIKKNSIIVEAILPQGWFEEQTKLLGIEWAKDFEGRATKTHVIDKSYFKHGGQVFVFRNSVYLIALGEEIVIEIRNSEIQKMILELFRFVQDNSRSIDANALLRKLIAEQLHVH
jgi:DNA-binding transcriptional ArsR family regulator